MLKAQGTKGVRRTINMRQATVAQWVALQLIFEVCEQQDTGYEGRGGGETTPVVKADGGRYSIEGRVKRDFGRSKGTEAT